MLVKAAPGDRYLYCLGGNGCEAQLVAKQNGPQKPKKEKIMGILVQSYTYHALSSIENKDQHWFILVV